MSDLETAYEFDLWSGLWLLSTALGRDVVVNRPRLPVFLNVYCIFVGESGWPRKSTATNHALQVARAYISKHTPQTIIVTNASTPQALVQALIKKSDEDERASVAINVSELVRFLGRETSGIDLPGMLTDLYDCPELIESPGTISHGPTKIRNVYVTMLSASTPAWLHRSINRDVITGGFTSRILFIFSNKGKQRIAWPNERRSFNAMGLAKELDRTTRDCKDHHRLIELDPAALRIYSKWYDSRKLHHDDFRASFESREDEHVLRISALLCINAGRWTCIESDVRTGIEIVGAAKLSASAIFETGLSRDRTTLGIEVVRRLLLESGPGGIKQSDLAKKVRHRFSIEDLRATLAVLKHMRYVRELIGQPKAGGRPHTRWCATERLSNEDIDTDSIIDMIPQFHKEMIQEC